MKFSSMANRKRKLSQWQIEKQCKFWWQIRNSLQNIGMLQDKPSVLSTIAELLSPFITLWFSKTFIFYLLKHYGGWRTSKPNEGQLCIKMIYVKVSLSSIIYHFSFNHLFKNTTAGWQSFLQLSLCLHVAWEKRLCCCCCILMSPCTAFNFLVGKEQVIFF